MTPLTLLRELRYAGVGEVAVVQTGPASLLPALAARLREVFPGCGLHVLLREADATARAQLDGAFVDVVCSGERAGLLRRLRGKRFDVVVVQLVGEPAGELATLPLLLRGRSLVVFNRNLDHFPVNLYRLTTLARHFGAQGDGPGGPLRAAYWLARGAAKRAVVEPVLLAYLLADAARIHLRGYLRRVRRGQRMLP